MEFCLRKRFKFGLLRLNFRKGRRENHCWSRDQHSARPWLDHWVYLSAVLPPASDAYVTSLSTRADGSIHLGLQARDAPVLSAIYEGLRAAGYQNVSPMPQTPQPDRFGYRFRSTVSMLAPFDMALKLETMRPPERPEDDGSLDASLWKPATRTSASAPSAAVVGAPVEIRPVEIRPVEIREVSR